MYDYSVSRYCNLPACTGRPLLHALREEHHDPGQRHHRRHRCPRAVHDEESSPGILHPRWYSSILPYRRCLHLQNRLLDPHSAVCHQLGMHCRIHSRYPRRPHLGNRCRSPRGCHHPRASRPRAIYALLIPVATVLRIMAINKVIQ